LVRLIFIYSSAYDTLICGSDPDTYYEFEVGELFWNDGTLLDQVINAGYPFTDLFDEPPADPSGYTHREFIMYTSPDVTPYTYDTLEQYYYSDGGSAEA